MEISRSSLASLNKVSKQRNCVKYGTHDVYVNLSNQERKTTFLPAGFAFINILRDTADWGMNITPAALTLSLSSGCSSISSCASYII